MRASFILFCCWLSLAQAAADALSYHISDSYPHDSSLFTQGLLLHDKLLYESSGLYGQSRLLIRKLDQLEPLAEYQLPKKHFAEGIAVFNNKLYQLNWRSQQGFIYDLNNLQLLDRFFYSGEGWGLTSNQHELIMSNGSAQLSFYQPEPFRLKRQLTVIYQERPLQQLNELEWVDGLIAANVWQSDLIVFIDPVSGQVVKTLDLSGLLPRKFYNRKTGVLNGIAYDQQRQRLYVTGKNWPRIYELKLSNMRPAQTQ